MQNIVKVDFQNKSLIQEDSYTNSSKEYGVFKVMRDTISAEKERIVKDYLSN